MLKLETQLEQFRKLQKRFDVVKDLSLGIDQGTGALRFCLVNRKSGEIVKWGSYEIAAQTASAHSEKEQKKQGSLSSCLKELSKDIPKNRLYSVFVNLRDPSLLIGNIEKGAEDNLKEEEFIQSSLRKELPFALEDACYFCRKVDDPKSSQKSFHFVALSKKAIPTIARPFEDGFGVMPSFTAEGYAHERVSELLDLAGRDETIALVNMGRSVTVLSIIQNKQLLFERDIPLAGQDLTRAILISYRKESTPRTTNDLDSSESLKRSSVIPVSGLGSTMTLMEPEENQKVYHAMEGILNAWVHDIRLSLHTFEEKFPSKKISRFYIMGGGANLNNLTGYLGSELGVDIELLKFPEGKFKLPTTPSPEPFKEKFHEYATALALAMHRDKHAILTPEEFFAGRIERMGQVALRIAPILLGGLLLTWFLFLNSSIHYLSEIKGILGQERLLLSRVEKPYLEMVRWERFLHEADSQTLPASNILKAISRHIPSNLLLSQLSFDRDSRTVMMDGFVYGDVKNRAITMTKFSKVLADTTHFQKVEVDRLQSLTGEEEAGLFRLRAELVEFKKA